MPYTCYRYPDDMPRGIPNRGAAQPPLPGMRQVPFTCFSYAAAAPPGIKSRSAARPGPGGFPSPPGGQPGLTPGARVSYPVWPCFRY